MKLRGIVLLAGWAHPADALAPLAAALHDPYRVSTLAVGDLMGDSAARDTDSYAAAFLEFIEESGGEGRAVIGWSMGGMVALEAASRRPELFPALVVVGGTARFTRDEGYEHGLPQRTVRAMRLGLRGSPSAVLERFFAEAAAPETEDGSVARRKVEAALSLGTAVLNHGLGYLEQTDIRLQLDRVTTPTLVLHGTEDRIVPWQAGRFLAASLKRSRFRLHEGAGHTLPTTEAAEVADDIRAYLEELS